MTATVYLSHPPHETATATLTRYGHLPTRTPGATLHPTDPATAYPWFGTAQHRRPGGP